MLGDLLKELREDKGITQIELSRFLKVTRQTISSYENGIVEPNVGTLIKLADYYECSLDYLTGRTKEKHNLNLLNKENKELLLEIIKVVEQYNVKKNNGQAPNKRKE